MKKPVNIASLFKALLLCVFIIVLIQSCDDEPSDPIVLVDSDNDGLIDGQDNCPTISNPGQEDSDNNGIGDVCDTTDIVDTDKDGVPDATDNCPVIPNADQIDTDNDGTGTDDTGTQ